MGYQNYKLTVYDKNFNIAMERYFENVMLNDNGNCMTFIDKKGKIVFDISVCCCTAVVEPVEKVGV
jgi:hypothetical protein